MDRIASGADTRAVHTASRRAPSRTARKCFHDPGLLTPSRPPCRDLASPDSASTDPLCRDARRGRSGRAHSPVGWPRDGDSYGDKESLSVQPRVGSRQTIGFITGILIGAPAGRVCRHVAWAFWPALAVFAAGARQRTGRLAEAEEMTPGGGRGGQMPATRGAHLGCRLACGGRPDSTRPSPARSHAVEGLGRYRATRGLASSDRPRRDH
jgi:hypothetical protein